MEMGSRAIVVGRAGAMYVSIEGIIPRILFNLPSEFLFKLDLAMIFIITHGA